jgi:acetyl esterase/lipase
MRSPIITICIACTARSMARRPRNVPAHPYLRLPRLVVTPGGSIAAVCSKHQLPPDWQFATHSIAYAERLKSDGNEVQLTNYAGMVHPFFSMGGAVDAGRRAITQATGALRRAYADYRAK